MKMPSEQQFSVVKCPSGFLQRSTVKKTKKTDA